MNRMRRLLPTILLRFATLFAIAGAARAQSITLFNIDTSNFPLMEADFLILDEQQRMIRDFNVGDLFIAENEQTIAPELVNYSCPSLTTPVPISAALVCDRSGSMSMTASGIPRLVLLKQGISTFLRTVRFDGNSEIAITAFDNFPILISDFDTSRNSLLGKVQSITLGDRTDYNAAFNHPLIGGITLLKSRPPIRRRVLIFITDGLHNASTPFQTQAVIDAAREADIEIYTITLAMRMPPSLDSLAKETGGIAFNDITTPEQMAAVYTAIALHTQEIEPCRIQWRSGNGCGPESMLRALKLTYKPRALVARSSYTAPERSVIALKTSPAYLWFGGVVPPDSATLPITITAMGSAMKIDRPLFGEDTSFTIVDWGGAAPPFTLQENESRTILIRFKPGTIGLHSVSLSFEGRPCPMGPIILSGGIGGGGNDPTALQLLSPLGGERFDACDSVVIRWAGVDSAESIRIEVSDDEGKIWKTLVDSATGLFYRWLPPAPGTSYRVRITALSSTGTDTIHTIVGGGAQLGEGIEGTMLNIALPAGLALDGDFLYFVETGRSLVRRHDRTTGKVTTVAGTGNAGFSGDGGPATAARVANPTGLAIHAGSLYIADYSNHRIRRVDLATGIISSFAGTGASGFSGDGGVAKNAELQFPARLVVGGDALYFTDQGNGRIRRIDLRTNIITTIAGGGWIPDGDGARATTVVLNKPLGIAYHTDPLGIADTLFVSENGAHRVRKIDMRTGLITTIAGTGSAGFSGDGGFGIAARLDQPQGIAIAGDNIYITDSRNNRLRVLSRSSRIIRTIAGTGAAGTGGDGGPALLARFTAPNDVVATSATVYLSDGGNSLIRKIVLGGPGTRDSSRSSFTVATARLNVGVTGKGIMFEPLALNSSRDTSATDAICNLGNVPLDLDSAVIAGANSADFEIVSGITSALVPPGSCNPVEIRFRPTGLGTRRAMAIFYGRCSGIDTLHLTGLAISPCGIEQLDVVDFGRVIAGTTRDTVIERSICNNGGSRIDGRIVVTPADGDFSILSGGGIFSLAPGECRRVTLRYAPKRGERSTAQIDFGTPASCGPADALLFGRGLVPQRLLTVGRIDYPGIPCGNGPRDTAIDIYNGGDAPLEVSDVQITANSEGFSLLPPLPSSTSPFVILPGEKRSIAIRFDPVSVGAKSATMVLTSNSAGGAVSVTLAGRRDSVGVSPEPSILAFNGRLPAERYPYDSFAVVRNTGTLPLTITGGTIGGTHGAKFELPAGQFPITIEPGDSARITVRALEPVNGDGYSGSLLLAFEPYCDTLPVPIDLFESGASPAISTSGPHFHDLLCADETSHDTVIIIRNPGGSTLEITGFELRGDGKDQFIFTPSLPISILPGEERSVAIRFAPGSAGTFSAELVLQSNAATGDPIVELTGRREPVTITASASPVDIGAVPLGREGSGFISIRNDGTTPVTLVIPAMIGKFRTQTSGTITVPPGEEYRLGVTFSSTEPGSYRDSITIIEPRCGTVLGIALEADAFVPAFAKVSLPVDSAGPGARVRIPIRVEIPDRELFAQKGGSDYTTTIAFSGAVLIPESAIGAQIVSSAFDPKTAEQVVTLSGRYTGSDTLALLVCAVPSTDSLVTPLLFRSFAWSSPEVLTDTVNGMFTVSSECYKSARIEVRPRVLKIRPMPIEERAEMEIEIDLPQMIRATLVDAAGREVAEITNRHYRAGWHVLPVNVPEIPSGVYSLVVDATLGRTVVQVVVRH